MRGDIRAETTAPKLVGSFQFDSPTDIPNWEWQTGDKNDWLPWKIPHTRRSQNASSTIDDQKIQFNKQPGNGSKEGKANGGQLSSAARVGGRTCEEFRLNINNLETTTPETADRPLQGPGPLTIFASH